MQTHELATGKGNGSNAASRALGLVCSAVLALSGCSSVPRTDFPVDLAKLQDQALASDQKVTAIPLTPGNIDRYSAPRSRNKSATNISNIGSWTYKVGVGDVLDVVVWDHPELTSPAGENRSPEESGLRVGVDGTFFYPYVGTMEAAGRTPEQIRKDLAEKLVRFIPDPQIVVRVVSYNSQAVSVTGEVEGASRQYLTEQPLTLLDAIDASGGITDTADASRVTVRRQGTVFEVNLEEFLESGNVRGNPLLQDGDVVSVPKRRLEEAYLLGQLVKPSTIDLSVEDVTLTQALTRVGGLVEDRADARGVFVFRNTPTGVMVFQLDVVTPLAFLVGTKFVLWPEDVVYVTTAPVSKWNALITSLLPSLTITSSSLSVARNVQ